jgi:UDP-N-acetyl-D-galactosamine dehydrogenase
MSIDTHAVLKAAGTKWNFLPFRPGLVGGHCIGVDPYYLAQKAQAFDYHPEIILAGRRINDSMGNYVASEVIKLMVWRDIKIKKAEILVLGITFKENCPDVRNTRTIDVIDSLKAYGAQLTVYDPWASKEEVKHELGLDLIDKLPDKKFSAIVLAVSHRQFLNIDIRSMLKKGGVLYDVKSILKCEVDGKL